MTNSYDAYDTLEGEVVVPLGNIEKTSEERLTPLRIIFRGLVGVLVVMAVVAAIASPSAVNDDQSHQAPTTMDYGLGPTSCDEGKGYYIKKSGSTCDIQLPFQTCDDIAHQEGWYRAWGYGAGNTGGYLSDLADQQRISGRYIVGTEGDLAPPGCLYGTLPDNVGIFHDQPYYNSITGITHCGGGFDCVCGCPPPLEKSFANATNITLNGNTWLTKQGGCNNNGMMKLKTGQANSTSPESCARQCDDLADLCGSFQWNVNGDGRCELMKKALPCWVGNNQNWGVYIRTNNTN